MSGTRHSATSSPEQDVTDAAELVPLLDQARRRVGVLLPPVPLDHAGLEEPEHAAELHRVTMAWCVRVGAGFDLDAAHEAFSGHAATLGAADDVREPSRSDPFLEGGTPEGSWRRILGLVGGKPGRARVRHGTASAARRTSVEGPNNPK